MTTALVVFGSVIVALAFIWGFAKMAEATGEAKAIREQAERDRAKQDKAGAVIAEHRTTRDAIDRLQRGDF